MPLNTVRMVPGGHLMSVDIKQYADLLLGSMTDQPVTLGSTLSIGGALTMLQIGTPANPPAGRMKIYPKLDGVFYSLDSTGLEVPLGSGTGVTVSGGHEEFLPAVATTFVDLATDPLMVLTVARGGVIQSLADGNYSLAGRRITFSDAFDGAERVVVAYLSGETPVLPSGKDAQLRTYIINLMAVLDPGGPPPP